MRVAIGEIEDSVPSPHGEGKTRLRHYPQRVIAPLGQENGPAAYTSGPIQSHNECHAPAENHSRRYAAIFRFAAEILPERWSVCSS
jgi:hypothetical protein